MSDDDNERSKLLAEGNNVSQSGSERYEQFGLSLIDSVTCVPFIIPHTKETNLIGMRLKISNSNDQFPDLLNVSIPFELLFPTVFSMVSLVAQRADDAMMRGLRYETLLVYKSDMLKYIDATVESLELMRSFVAENFEDDGIDEDDGDLGTLSAN